MAFIATIPRQRIALVPPHAVRSLIIGGAWRHGFALLGDSLSLLVQGRVSKETHPDIRVSLRETPLPPVPLRGPAYKGHPWPFKRGRLVLSPHPCGSLPYATPTLGLLTGSLRACRFRVSSRSELSVCLAVGRVQLAQPAYAGFTRSTQWFLRGAGEPSKPHATATARMPHQKIEPGSGPVRRLSGIVEPGVKWHEYRESADGPKMSLCGTPPSLGL